MTRLFLALPIALAATSSCELGQTCTTNIAPGILVTIVDSTTGSPITETATVIATHGTYADTAIVPPPMSGPVIAWLAEERAGFYRVEARAPGYAPWTSSLLHVEQGDCHVRTVDVTARLAR